MDEKTAIRILQKKVIEREEQLAKHGGHTPGCRTNQPVQNLGIGRLRKCDCGWAELETLTNKEGQ